MNVILITSFGEWANLYGGGGPPGTEVLRYAFALNPAAPGDGTQLPVMYADGRTRILSHFKHRHATDLAYQYEVSTDLVNWSVAQNGIHYYEFTTDLADGLLRSDLVILVDWPRAFFRPRATLIP